MARYRSSSSAPNELLACERMYRPVHAYYVTMLTVNIYQTRPPPTVDSQWLVLAWAGYRKVDRKKWTWLGGSGVARWVRGHEGRTGRAARGEDRLKIPKWSTPLRSWNRLAARGLRGYATVPTSTLYGNFEIQAPDYFKIGIEIFWLEEDCDQL